MRELLDLLKAGLTDPDDMAHYARSIPPRRLFLLDAVILVILSLVIIVTTAFVRGEFQSLTLLILPLAFLLAAVCGGIGFVWCVNSKGEGSFTETILGTPPVLFLPVLASLLFMTLDRLFVLPLYLTQPSIWLQIVDVVAGFLGPILGWYFYFRFLAKLHNLKKFTHAGGSSLVAIFVTVVVAYLLGSLL